MPFEQRWSDVKGPMKKDFFGNKYLVIFTCEETRYTAVCFCKRKKEVSERFRDFDTWVKSIGFRTKLFNTDNDGE